MKLNTRHLTTLALLAAVAAPAIAGPFTGGMKSATDDVKTIATGGAALIGGAMTLFAGGKAAWKAYKDEDWVGYGITAVVSVAIAFVAGAAL